MSHFPYAPHPHLTRRREQGPVKVADQLPTSSARGVVGWYARSNSRLAMALTKRVGTMSCFWVFNIVALLSLPATLHLMGVIPAPWGPLPSFFLTFGFIYLITWICQNYIQLVLLPALMVGQNLQGAAADKRSEMTFNDAEAILHEIGQLQAHVAALEAKLPA